MKKNLPLVLIIASLILIVTNFIMTEKLDRVFWVTTLSSVLVIMSMIMTIIVHKKQDDK